jgi:hypothetical protein
MYKQQQVYVYAYSLYDHCCSLLMIIVDVTVYDYCRLLWMIFVNDKC